MSATGSMAAAIALAAGTILALPALAECDEGETATVTGVIEEKFVAPNIMLVKGSTGECTVDSIWLNDDISLPAGCVAGLSVTATGTSGLSEDDKLDLEEAHSISCK